MNKNKKTKVVGYVIGSITLFAATAIMIPVVLPKLSGKINKSLVKKKNSANDDEDWDPVIEKKDLGKDEVNED